MTEQHAVSAYIGLGGNLDDPAERVSQAVFELDSLPDCRVDQVSSLYRSAPLGPPGQADYINAVACLCTRLSARKLLSAMQYIEQRHGRDSRGPRWGPRTLDLDLLLYADRIIDEPDLSVPHPEMASREFVLYPLYEIAPSLFIPGMGWLKEHVAQCPRRGLRKLEALCESRTS